MRFVSFVSVSLVLSSFAAGCSTVPARGDAPPGSGDASGAVVIDTSSPEARAQYDANVAYALGYAPRCTPDPTSHRPRVLVTGFGRFLSTQDNATGEIVTRLVPGAVYPFTVSVATTGTADVIDDPSVQTAVTLGKVTLPDVGDVDVCGMVLPVYWDLAAVLIAKEIDAFGPDLVVMNGVAGFRQPLWIELGALNRAETTRDGSDRLVPVPAPGDTLAHLVPEASADDEAKGMLLSWTRVREAAESAIAARTELFGDVLDGAKLAGFPRPGNTYLCNNVSYVTNWLMSYPKTTITLMEASVPVDGKPNAVKIALDRDETKVPRTFVHWPIDLVDDPKLLDGGADVLRAMIAAQLTALRSSAPEDAPTVGRNAQADPSLAGGDTY